MEYLLLAVGFILLIKGADFFVEGSSSAARLLKIPSVIIGLTIVAMGTSAPEAAVSINAGLIGNNEIALSNITGSNLFNLLIVIGICALMRPFDTDRTILNRDLPINLGLTFLLFLIMLDGKLSRFDGVLLLIGMAAYIGIMIRSALKNREHQADQQKVLSPLRSVIYIVLGLGAVIWGGDLVVDSASHIAAALGMSQTLIGLTIVAVGTSLPELVTSIVAARKGESGLALGNVVGSNIFNILFILGMSSALHPIKVGVETLVDTTILIFMTILMFLFCRTGKKVKRSEGAIAILLYAGYLIYAILR